MDKVVRLLLAVACVVGCSFQVYNISKIYFEYETTTIVKYRNNFNISLPAVTLCIDKKYMLQDQFLPNVIPSKTRSELNEDDFTQIKDYINNMTVTEQFQVLFDSFDIFRNHCWVMTPNAFVSNSSGDYMQCNEVQPIRRSIDYFNSCFTIFHQKANESEEEERFSIDFDVSIQNYWLEIMNLKIHLNITSVNLYIHSRKHKICDSFDFNMIKINRVKGEKSCIKYHVHEVHLLPEPYSTKCVKFNDKGYRSRLDCVLKCKIRKLRMQYKKWPGNFLTGDNDEFDIDNQTMINMIQEMGDNTSMDLEIGKICRKECGLQQDCQKEYFFFFESKFANRSENDFVIDFFPPDLPNLLVEHSPKIEFEEFMCYLASIFSLWFGFSFLMFTELLSIGFVHFVRICNNYKTKVMVFIYKPILLTQEVVRERTFSNKMFKPNSVTSKI